MSDKPNDHEPEDNRELNDNWLPHINGGYRLPRWLEPVYEPVEGTEWMTPYINAFFRNSAVPPPYNVDMPIAYHNPDGDE